MNQNQKQTEITKLKAKIARARKRLEDLWEERGCTDYDVLAAGMVLDELINEYERLTWENRSNNPLRVAR